MQPYYCNWHNLSLVISLHWHIPTIRCHWYCHNTALVGVGMLQFSTTSIMKLDVIFWRWGMEKSYNSDIDLLVNFFLFFFFFALLWIYGLLLCFIIYYSYFPFQSSNYPKFVLSFEIAPVLFWCLHQSLGTTLVSLYHVPGSTNIIMIFNSHIIL